MSRWRRCPNREYDRVLKRSAGSWKNCDNPNLNLSVVLVSPRNPLNIGAAARAMSNFGFCDLRLVNPYEVAFREAVSAVGAGAVMEAARVYDTVEEAVAGCSLVAGTSGGDRREMTLPLHRLETGARMLREHSGGVALLFGSEKSGLTNEEISHCHWVMQIPARAEHRSMNLGQAVAVCLYELIRDERMALQPVLGKKHAEAVLIEELRQRVAEALTWSGYYDHTGTAGAERRLRELIHRMNLSERDAVVWLGIFRQVLWKLKS
ncbi:MAG: TrmJ/YjtD family RNA methyltransferase [Bryobacterales bacterium]|nr:TrmJ/YjtD family RNA methyltransferase [Bryobacterales bacterium]